MPPPRGTALVWIEIPLFGQMDTAGTESASSWLHVCPLQGHLTPARFDDYVFFKAFSAILLDPMSSQIGFQRLLRNSVLLQMGLISQSQTEQAMTAVMFAVFCK